MRLILGDAKIVTESLPYNSVQTCITSPPYFGLRDYGVDGQIGLEGTLEEYVKHLVAVFREVKKVLRDDGTLWLNLGDSYSAGGRSGGGKQDTNKGSIGLGTWKVDGFAPKQLLGIPWRVAFALQADGWYLRQDIIWAKPNPMPESVTDRCTKAHEYIFLLSKSPKYYFDHEAIKEEAAQNRWGGHIQSDLRNSKGDFRGLNRQRDMMPETRNKRSVWTVSTKPYKGAHFATFPPDLIEPCILAGAPEGGVVLDPFMGSGTTGYVAKMHNRDFIGIELNPDYLKLAKDRIAFAPALQLAMAAE